MAPTPDEAPLPNLSELLGYDFEDDEPDLSQVELPPAGLRVGAPAAGGALPAPAESEEEALPPLEALYPQGVGSATPASEQLSELQEEDGELPPVPAGDYSEEEEEDFSSFLEGLPGGEEDAEGESPAGAEEDDFSDLLGTEPEESSSALPEAFSEEDDFSDLLGDAPAPEASAGSEPEEDADDFSFLLQEPEDSVVSYEEAEDDWGFLEEDTPEASESSSGSAGGTLATPEEGDFDEDFADFFKDSAPEESEGDALEEEDDYSSLFEAEDKFAQGGGPANEEDSEGDSLGEETFTPEGEDAFFAEEDEEEDSLPSEEEEEDAEETPKSSKKSKKASGKSKKSKKGWWAAFKAQAAAELAGKDAPEEEPEEDEEEHGKELALREESGSELEKAPGRGKKGRSGASAAKPPNLLRKLLSPLLNLYFTVIDFVFKVLDGLLAVLGKLPLVGRLFRPLRKFTRALKALAHSLPLMVLLVVLVVVNQQAVPSQTRVSLPDEGGATFTSFKLEKANGVVSGVVENTGNVVAEVLPVFTVYSLKTTLNPVTWVLPQAVGECPAEPLAVGIEEVAPVTAACPFPLEGLQVRVSGELR